LRRLGNRKRRHGVGEDEEKSRNSAIGEKRKQQHGFSIDEPAHG